MMKRIPIIVNMILLLLINNINGEIPEKYKNFILIHEDLLQSGFTQEQSVSIDNKTSAKNWSMAIDTPDKWLSKLESWGRIEGYRIVFQRIVKGSLGEPNADIIISDVDIFKSEGGASKAFSKFQELNQSEEIGKRILEESGMKLIKFEIRKNPKLGDESMMIYFKVSITTVVPGVFETISISWRNGKIISSIQWMSYISPIFESDIINLANIVQKRIRTQREKQK